MTLRALIANLWMVLHRFPPSKQQFSTPNGPSSFLRVIGGKRGRRAGLDGYGDHFCINGGLDVKGLFTRRPRAVFITALIHVSTRGDVSRISKPFAPTGTEAKARLGAAADDACSRFDYEIHLSAC